MNAKKITAVFCAVLFLNCILAENIFGQNATVPQPTVNKPVEPVQPPVGDDTADNQFASKRQNDRYRIGYDDTIEVQVFKHPELSRVANVNNDGTILLPRLDKPIHVACKTETELGEIIGTLYKSYLKNPFVTVRAIEQRSQPFAIIGAVEKPGSFYLNRRTRLSGLLALAGGPKIEKAGAKVQVARVGNVSGCEIPDDATAKNDDIVFFTYKLKDVVDNKENPWLEPGDIVNVLEAEEAYVVGNVIKPTRFSLKEPVTLTQAIAIGGGLAPESKSSKITIQRQDANSALKTETVYDLKDIREKKIADPVLQANDIVNVPKDGAKAMRNGVIEAFKNAIPSALIFGL